MKPARPIILFALVCFCCLSSLAQDNPQARPVRLRVDRPSFANSSDVVGEGVHSLEAGVLVTGNKGTRDALTQTPLLYRVGLKGEFEFRLATSGLNNRGSDLGWSDLTPGFKWNFHKSDKVSASLVGAVSLPLGDKDLRPGGLLPALSVAVDVPLNSDTGLLFNLGALSPGTGQERVVQAFATAGISRSLNEKVSVYVEAAVFSPDSPAGKNTVAGDVVLSYLVNNNLQLDAAFFKGFSGGGLDWASTVGFAQRF